MNYVGGQTNAYVLDNSGTVELYSKGSKITGLYDAGTQDSTTYYTKS